MENMIERVTVTETGLANKTLNNYVKQIATASLKVQTQAFRVAWIVAQISENKLWSDDFESFESFGEQILGKKKATLYNMCKVGRDWVTKDGHTIFYDGKLDYISSQLYALMRTKAPKDCGFTTVEKVTEWHNNGVINPLMSCEELKAIVDAHNSQYTKTKKQDNKEDKEPKVVGKAEVTATATVKHALEFLESEEGLRMLTFEGITCKLTEDQYVQALSKVAEIMSLYEPIIAADVVEVA